eukprot:3933498-Rhodomonas_salina.2
MRPGPARQWQCADTGEDEEGSGEEGHGEETRGEAAGSVELPRQRCRPLLRLRAPPVHPCQCPRAVQVAGVSASVYGCVLPLA